MLSNDLLTKDMITLYKIFLLNEGDRIQLNVSEDTFGINRNSAMAEYLKEYIRKLQEENQDITLDEILDNLDALKGRTFKLVEIRLKKEIFANVKYQDYFEQDRNVIRTSLNMYPHSGMSVTECALESYEIDSNGAGGYNVTKVKVV